VRTFGEDSGSRLVRSTLLLALFLLACTPRSELTLRFRAMVGERPFRRAEVYRGLAGGADELTLSELRFYVSRPRLLDAAGREYVLNLNGDARTSAQLSLLDFAEAPERSLRGSLALPADARPVALAFELGVPFSENHQDVSTARAPLDASNMFWVWRHGYKFLRLEAESRGTSGAQPVSVHLGSTGCAGESPIAAPARCKHPNRVQVRLERFDAKRDVVQLDLAPLLASLSLPARDASAGCESDPEDPDCAGVFAALGLRGSAGQRVFRAVRETR